MLIPWLPPYTADINLLAILVAALAIDAIAGDPGWLYRALPHPVAVIGRAVAILDARWNDPAAGAGARQWRGVLAVLLITISAAGIAWAFAYALRAFSWGWIVEAIVISTLLAFRGLYDHVRRVALALDQGIEPGRRAVAEIVGRDPASLDEAGVARAAIESTAENFADGVVAPVFWFLIAGLPGIAAYKAINTLDSMIGHRTPHHLDFGRFAARLDDLVNIPPARIAGGLIVIAAAFTPGAGGTKAWRTMRRDAPGHRSPNAGWTEAAMAGALGLALAGPRQYDGEAVADAWMGNGRTDAGPRDIRRALGLYLGAGAVLALPLLAGLLI